MNLYDFYNQNEGGPAYRQMQGDNLNRLHGLTASLITASLTTGKTVLSSSIIQMLNYHAIAGLHSHCGVWRPWNVAAGEHFLEDETVITPEGKKVGRCPRFERVPSLMNDFVNTVNFRWHSTDWEPMRLAAYVLWKINFIHPFVNGNGRTARSLCYYVLCTKLGGLLPGKESIPSIISNRRDEYTALLNVAHETYHQDGEENHLDDLVMFVNECIAKQLSGQEN